MERVLVYSRGLCFMSVCVVKDASAEEIEASVGPSGTRRGWRMSEEKTFRTGEPNPCQCKDYRDRLHYLLEC